MLAWLGVAVFSACKKQDTEPPKPQVERIILDTPYAAAADRQKMDIYLPADRNENTMTIVLVHGGGWVGGSKADLTSGIPSFRQQFPGYAFANINYRLASGGTSNLFPTQEQDVQAAVGLITTNHAAFGISSRVVLVGFSAGAHLALLHGYKNDPGKHVAAVVNFFGPTDLEALWDAGDAQRFMLASVTGKIYPDGKQLYRESGPVNYVTPQSPPTITLHGALDELVPVSQANLLVSKLEEKAVMHELVLYPSEGHGWMGEKLLHSIEKIKGFLKDHVE